MGLAQIIGGTKSIIWTGIFYLVVQGMLVIILVNLSAMLFGYTIGLGGCK